MDQGDTVDLALRALFAAADEDVATGGPDLVRRIFPTVAVIDGDGFHLVGDDEIAQRAEQEIGGREEGAGL
jgi:proteasome beta subunit